MTRRSLYSLAAITLLGLVVLRFPLFHVKPLPDTKKNQQSHSFEPAATATAFWQNKLVSSAEQAIPISQLWKALASGAAARKQFGHSPGMSSVTYFLVQGSGKITRI